MLTGGPDGLQLPALFDFQHDMPAADNKPTLYVFEHVEGAEFCHDLYGHYLLPNGKLAHFYVPCRAQQHGHIVQLPAPPTTPWTEDQWLPEGLLPPPCTAVLLPYLQLGSLQVLCQDMWIPVSGLAPAPSRYTLHCSKDAATGALQLHPGPIRLKAVVNVVIRTEEQRLQVEKPRANKRRPTAAAAGRSVTGK